MPEVHRVVGFAVVAIFAVGWIWGLGAWILKRVPGDRFWWWLTVAQVTAGLQALLGIALLVLGHRVDAACRVGADASVAVREPRRRAGASTRGRP